MRIVRKYTKDTSQFSKYNFIFYRAWKIPLLYVLELFIAEIQTKKGDPVRYYQDTIGPTTERIFYIDFSLFFI